MGTLYLELARELAHSLEAGVYQAGEKMPGIRATSTARKVSAATVVSAYRQLELEGYIESRPRSGFYVCRRNRLQLAQPECTSSEPERPRLVEAAS
ncbi:MAG: GntR family transcriptional regulator [Exilibacterium sp.]